MLSMSLLACVGEAFLFQHAAIVTIPGQFLTSQC